MYQRMDTRCHAKEAVSTGVDHQVETGRKGVDVSRVGSSRHLAPERRLLRPSHHAHAPLADFVDETVVGERRIVAPLEK